MAEIHDAYEREATTPTFRRSNSNDEASKKSATATKPAPKAPSKSNVQQDIMNTEVPAPQNGSGLTPTVMFRKVTEGVKNGVQKRLSMPSFPTSQLVTVPETAAMAP